MGKWIKKRARFRSRGRAKKRGARIKIESERRNHTEGSWIRKRKETQQAAQGGKK